MKRPLIQKCPHNQTCGGNCMLCGEKGVHVRRNLEVELQRILSRGLIKEGIDELFQGDCLSPR